MNRENVMYRVIFALAMIWTAALIGLAAFQFYLYWEFSPKRRSVSQLPNSMGDRFSMGEKILGIEDPLKLSGSEAFGNGNFRAAQLAFDQVWRKTRDPESLLYAQNALAARLSKDEGISTILIGASVPLGANRNIAAELLRGIAQGQLEINSKGGANGKLLQVLVANDDNNPDIAKSVAREFSELNQVLVVIGHNTSGATIAAAEVYEETGLVAISPSAVAREISNFQNVFRTTYDTRSITQPLAEFAVAEGITPLAICSDNGYASQSFVHSFSYAYAEFGGKLVDAKCNFSTGDFSAAEAVSEAYRRGAEGVLLAPSVSQLKTAMEVARANHDRSEKLMLLGNHSLNTWITLETGEAVESMVIPVQWHVSTAADPQFVKRALDLWRGSINWRTAFARDAVITIAEVLKGGGLSRKSFRKHLVSGLVVEGASGTISFLPSGDRIGTAQLLQVESSNTTSAGIAFVPLRKKTGAASAP